MIAPKLWGVFALFLSVPSSLAAQNPPSLQVDHIAIYVSDLKTSVAFYKDVFGFQEVQIPVPFASWLSMGKGVILNIVAGRKEPVANSQWDHLSIACSDMKAITASLDAKHIVWSSMDGKSQPAVRFDGFKQIFIKDSDGYWIEINDALKESAGVK